MRWNDVRALTHDGQLKSMSYENASIKYAPIFKYEPKGEYKTKPTKSWLQEFVERRWANENSI